MSNAGSVSAGIFGLQAGKDVNRSRSVRIAEALTSMWAASHPEFSRLDPTLSKKTRWLTINSIHRKSPWGAPRFSPELHIVTARPRLTESSLVWRQFPRGN